MSKRQHIYDQLTVIVETTTSNKKIMLSATILILFAAVLHHTAALTGSIVVFYYLYLIDRNSMLVYNRSKSQYLANCQQRWWAYDFSYGVKSCRFSGSKSTARFNYCICSNWWSFCQSLKIGMNLPNFSHIMQSVIES